MKKVLALILLALLLPSLTGCAGCGCRERLRDCFRRGAICGSRSTVAAPAPIVYSQPAPVQQYVQPQQQFVQPTVPAPIVAAPTPRQVMPQYAAPATQCCPCVPCCPPVCQPCCPTYDPCGCPDGSYSVGSPIYEGGWMSGGCCDGSYSGSSERGTIITEPRPALPNNSNQPANTPDSSDPGPNQGA